MLPTLAVTIDTSDPQIYGYGLGGAGLVWFLFNNRDRITAIARSIWELVTSFRKAPEPTPVSATISSRLSESSEALDKQLAAIQTLNKAELDLISNGHIEGLQAVAAARKVVPDLRSDAVKVTDAALIDHLFSASRYFRANSNKAGLDAVIAAYKAMAPAAQPEVKP